MLDVTVRFDQLIFGQSLAIDFQRTLRIPDDGKTYPLPPGFGQFPVRRIADYADRVPESWAKRGGVFIPLYQREALWINFLPRHWKPNAVKVAVGMINAVSGKRWDQELHQDKNDYLVCPPQPWLDGINAGHGEIRQFVAMPLGMGYTVEGQLTGEERFGGIQLVVYEPKPGHFPDQPERPRADVLPMLATVAGEMGMAAGGHMKQKIYPDPHGYETWDQENYGRVFVHMVNSLTYREITGEEAPPTPITAKTYAQHDLPWFDLYDEEYPDVDSAEELEQVKSVKEMDQEKGFQEQQDDESIQIDDDQVIRYPPPGDRRVEDGDWEESP